MVSVWRWCKFKTQVCGGKKWVKMSKFRSKFSFLHLICPPICLLSSTDTFLTSQWHHWIVASQSHIFTVKYTKYGPKTAEWRRWSERKQQQSQAYVINNQQHPNNHWHKHKKCSYLNIRILFPILEFKHFHFIFVQSSTLPAQACVHSFVASHTCGLKCVFCFCKIHW